MLLLASLNAVGVFNTVASIPAVAGGPAVVFILLLLAFLLMLAVLLLLSSLLLLVAGVTTAACVTVKGGSACADKSVVHAPHAWANFMRMLSMRIHFFDADSALTHKSQNLKVCISAC
jgi:hypothetical protein